MTIKASRVGIVGGSIAGCAAAIALRRAGCDVTVYERSAGELQARGLGIGIPVPVYEELVAAGYFDADMPVHRCPQRIFLTRDPDGPGGQREIHRHPFEGVTNHWGLLWRNLRARIADEDYRQPATVREVVVDSDGATIVTDEGSERFDVVVGADGYRSITRALVDPRAEPSFAGYVLWRGTYPVSLLDGRVPEELEGLVMIGLPRGHAVCYLIPDLATGRRVSWGVYGFVPPSVRFDPRASVPPGSIGDELLDVLDHVSADLPPAWTDLLRRTPRRELSVQPVHDMTISSYTADRVMLIGDAATSTRPHSGAGATKALLDALALERACRDSDTWEQAMAVYEQARRPSGNEIVDLGRRLGRAQVEQPPNWARMTARTFRDWLIAGTLTVGPYESRPDPAR